MGAFIRLYTFLSQIFDYCNTGIEKRAIFYKRLLPLLEFGREREGYSPAARLNQRAVETAFSGTLSCLWCGTLDSPIRQNYPVNSPSPVFL
jgi:hypothetical protein